MEQLEVDLKAVRALCRTAQIFEAHSALLKLEASLVECLKVAGDHGDENMAHILKQLDGKLKADPVLLKLRLIHERMLDAVKMLRTSNARTKSEVTMDIK